MGSIRNQVNERRKIEKEDVITLLREQIEVEGKAIRMYEETVKDVKSKPIRHILHTIQLDSMRQIDFYHATIDVLQGEWVLSEEKKELLEGLKRHLELEVGSIDKVKKILENVWIRENPGLTELIKNIENDEKRHDESLRKLINKTFLEVADINHNLGYILRGAEFIEEKERKLGRIPDR